MGYPRFGGYRVENISIADRIDRALTIGGIGQAPSGELSPVTKEIYAGQYAKACEWKRAELPQLDGSLSRTFTPEQLAQYALWKVQNGYARSTAGLAVRSIRWGHRVAGLPVPDALPAYYVLRAGEPTAGTSEVNYFDSPARHDPTEILTAFASACRIDRPIGRRDMCLITMMYATGMRLEALTDLDIEDLRPVAGVNAWMVPTPDGPARLECSAGDGTTHNDVVCPSCCLGYWLYELRNEGARTGPLFRSIDKGSNIGGTTTRKAGVHTPGGRLRPLNIPESILRPLCVQAGLTSIRRSPARALRIAGAAAAYVAGEITLERAAARAGYSPTSGLLLRHLLELVREDTP